MHGKYGSGVYKIEVIVMSKVRAILVLILAACILNAQELVWQKTYGGNKDDVANALKVLPDGSIVVAGWTESYGAGGQDVYVVKIDRDGNKIWEKTFGGIKDDWANALQVLADESIVVAGWTMSYRSNGYDFDVYVLKLDKDGNKIWEKTFGGIKDDRANALQVLDDGSIVVAGWAVSYGAGGYDVYILKLDKEGDKIWEKVLGGVDGEKIYSLQTFDGGNIVVAGCIYSYKYLDYDVYVLKTKSQRESPYTQLPPFLEIKEVKVTDSDEDGIFSAGENAYVKLKIANTGKGNAYNVKLRITGFINRNIKIGEIKKGEEIEKSISFKIPLKVKTGEKSIRLMVDAGEYSPEPVVVKFYTHAPLPPSFRVIASIDDDNVGLSVGNGDGIIQPREQIELHLKVKNVGKGEARDVEILGTPKNGKIRMIKSEDKLGNLPPGGEVEGTLVFFVPSGYSRKNMAIDVRIEEATGLWNVEKELDFPIGRELRKEYVIKSRKGINGEGEFGAEFMVKSGGIVDVDENIPVGYSRSNAIGIVISNKNYEHSDVPPVDYAIHDGEIVKEYFKRTFGIPERNIYFVKNAKKVDFEVWFGTGKDYRGKLYRLIRKGSNPDIYIYYAGHGAPDPATRSAYFVPVDANPSYIALSGYPLDLFYKNLSKLPARSINIIIDACFSGGSQRGMLIARASPLGVVPVFKSKKLPSNFTIITATDTTGEIASWYPQKRHSLFTYYFLKGIRGEADGNKDRKITLSELQNYLESEVSYTAGKLYNRDQHPMVIGNLNKIFVRLR